MSVQGAPKLRSSPIAGFKSGPLKAILPVSSLLKKDPSLKKSKSNSPTTSLKSRFSPDGSLSGFTSPGSLKGIKSRSPNSKTELLPAAGCIRRTASLDAIYLKGQWPQECFYPHTGMLQVNKATQTDDYLSDRRQRHSESVTSEDAKLEKYIRHRLQRVNKETQSMRMGLRLISPPTQGDHSLGGMQTPPTLKTPPSVKTPPSSNLSGPQSPVQPIPGTRSALGRPTIRNSVEGLNQEIERLVLKEMEDRYSTCCSIPEGHRAPLADLLRQTRSVNTQTPGGSDELDLEYLSSEASSRGSMSPMLMGPMDTPSCLQGSRDCSPDDLCSFGTSPHINKFLAREPPDGCEKVSLRLDETRLEASEAPPRFIPLKPMTTFEFKQSLGSAFQPLQQQQGLTADVAAQQQQQKLVNGQLTPDAERISPLPTSSRDGSSPQANPQQQPEG